MEVVIGQIRQDLIKFSDQTHKISGERYFREAVKLYGVKAVHIRRIAREHFKRLTDRTKDHVFRCCELLFISGMMEEALIACLWAEKVNGQYQPGDFSTFDKWVNNYITNWATCDTLCNHAVGDLVTAYPELLPELRKWARSSNRWVKRAAAVSLIIPARKGLFTDDILEIASILIADTDDMVQKGYGWMLKACSESNLEIVYNFVTSNKQKMPRTALRYAIEKMPAEMKAEAMKK